MACIVADEIELFRGLSDRVMEENQRYITCTAHDLKTPLQVFRLATELFKEHLKSQLHEQEAAVTAAAVAKVEAEFAEVRGSKLSSATMPKSRPSSFSSSLSEDEPPPSSERITTRNRSEFARSCAAAAAAAASTAELLDVAVQAEGACDMMDETVCNAIDAARARWTCNGENRGGDASNSSGFLEVDLAALVGDCRRLSAWHHGEAVGWTVEVAPEVIDTQIPH
jgi:signal transduction histidine kinase